MNRWLGVAVVAAAIAAPAKAHHIWIIPDAAGGATAKAVFSDYLEPDGSSLLAKVAHTKLWARDAAGRERAVEWMKGTDSFTLEAVGTGGRTVGGSCVYGVETYDHRLRRKVEPFLLAYYPKAVWGTEAGKAWDKLPLEIVPTIAGDEVQLRVLFQGKPLAKAEMRVQSPGADRQVLATDDRGEIKVRLGAKGPYGFQTRAIETKAGEHDGKKYATVRHHATLVFNHDGKAGR